MLIVVAKIYLVKLFLNDLKLYLIFEPLNVILEHSVLEIHFNVRSCVAEDKKIIFEQITVFFQLYFS